MIIIQLTGGLGNQLFQYAMGRALSERSKDILLFDISSYSWDTLRKYELGIFNLKYHYATMIEITHLKHGKPFFKDRIMNKLKNQPIPYFRLSNLKEQSFKYDTNYLNFKSKDVYVEGYWQSENYFSHIRNVLLNEICLEETRCSNKMKEYKSKIEKTINSVSIHIRRGDYVSNTQTTAFHGLCGLQYYKNAMQHIEQSIPNPTYFIFSDDKAYVKEVFNGKQNLIIIENVPNDYEELFLMSYCNHNIIANSSFSWWGAWLNDTANKQVISPEKWFANIEMNNQTQSLIPQSWIRK